MLHASFSTDPPIQTPVKPNATSARRTAVGAASTPSGAGIAGVVNGGIATASNVLETDPWKAIRDGDVLGDCSLLPELTPGWDAWRESH